MSLELDGMVYSSFLDLDNQMEQEEDSDSDGHFLGTFLAFFWAMDATLEEVGISVLKSGIPGSVLQSLNLASLPLLCLFLHLKKMILSDNQRSPYQEPC